MTRETFEAIMTRACNLFASSWNYDERIAEAGIKMHCEYQIVDQFPKFGFMMKAGIQYPGENTHWLVFYVKKLETDNITNGETPEKYTETQYDQIVTEFMARGIESMRTETIKLYRGGNIPSQDGVEHPPTQYPLFPKEVVE